MKRTEQTLSLVSIVKEYLANQLTRHPSRYAKIMHIIHKYQIYHIITRLGALHRYGNRNLSGDTLQEHRIYAEKLAKALEELGACFIKLGQVISTRPDLLPSPYITALSRLQHTVTAVPGDQIAAIVEYDLGRPLSDIFQFFDLKPLATASIAQVHKAVLHDGSHVVIKVQRPGVQQQIEVDVEVMQEIARFVTRHTPLGARYGLTSMVQEIKQSLSQELDFLQEADNTQSISRDIREFRHLMTPTIYPAYSSRRVLTLSFIPGCPLAQVPSGKSCHAEPATVATELLSAYLKQIVVNGLFHCDPHPGNILLVDDGRLALLDFGMIGRLDARQIDHLILLLLAFSERRGERVADIYLEMIETPERFDRRAFTQEICTLVCRYHDMSEKGIEIGRALLDLATVASVYHTAIPANFTLLGKALLNLDGTLRILSPNLNLTQTIRHYMQQVIRQRMLTQISPGRSAAWLLDAKHLIENTLQRSEAILDRLAHDQFSTRVQVEHLDETIQRAARRLSFGMVVSSFILSMTLLITSKRHPKL